MFYLPELSNEMDMYIEEEHLDDCDEINLLKGTYELWHGFVKQCVSFLRRRRYYKAAAVLGGLLIEPHHSLKAGVLQLFGKRKAFHFHGMNPIALTPEEAELPAILLIHGNHDNQRAWLSLGKRLKEEKIRMVFTLNLPSGLFSSLDKELIERKWNQILSLYQTHGKIPKIDVLGHSRGSRLALRLNFHKEDWWIKEDSSPHCTENPRRRIETGKTIILGGRPNHNFLLDRLLYDDPTNRIFHIDAMHDLLIVKTKIRIPHSRRVIVKGGHLGLTFSKEAFDHVIRFLTLD